MVWYMSWNNCALLHIIFIWYVVRVQRAIRFKYVISQPGRKANMYDNYKLSDTKYV